MKSLKFLLAAVCISAGLAAFGHVKASEASRLPNCQPFPDESCLARLPDGTLGFLVDHHQE